MPVSINYHAGGIRVQDIASNVGLGWNLNAGGQITRIVRQLPDDTFKGYMMTENTVENFISAGSDSFIYPSEWEYRLQPCGPQGGKIDLFRNALLGNIDYAPDEFYFLGYSGKFVFNQERSPASSTLIL